MNYFMVQIKTDQGMTKLQWANFKGLYPRAARLMERTYRKFDVRSVDFNNKRINIRLV